MHSTIPSHIAKRPPPTPINSNNSEPKTNLPQASLGSEISDKFQAGFHDDEVYEERQCGSNIRRFAERLSEQALEGAKVLAIRNTGFSFFGLVRARHVRDTNLRNETRVTDKNWYHHVVMEKDGRIYDFDYGIEPSTPKVDEYFEKMFFADDGLAPERKRKDYEIQVIDAKEYLEAKKDSSTKMSMGEYLE